MQADRQEEGGKERKTDKKTYKKGSEGETDRKLDDSKIF